MGCRIGLISDVHATPAPVHEALAAFARIGVDFTICAGDIAGYGDELEATIELLRAHRCYSIQGNHDAWLLAQRDPPAVPGSREYLAQLPSTRQFTVTGCSVYVVHASPPCDMQQGIALLDQQGEPIPERKRQWSASLATFGHEVLIVGHTHQVFAESLGATLVINPGSTKFNHSCALLDLPSLAVEFLPLCGQAIRRSWHWGMIAAS